VEVLCAILILGIAMAGLSHGLTTALSSSKETEQQTEAALLAAGRVELLRADGYLVDGSEEGDGGTGLSAYHWEQTVSSTQIDGLHDVKVVVQQSKSGQTIYELQTLLFDASSTAANPDERATRKSTGPNRRRDRRAR
jgi:Tfp pilus assembly protein PilV